MATRTDTALDNQYLVALARDGDMGGNGHAAAPADSNEQTPPPRGPTAGEVPSVSDAGTNGATLEAKRNGREVEQPVAPHAIQRLQALFRYMFGGNAASAPGPTRARHGNIQS